MAYENLKSTGIKYLLGKLKTVFLQVKDAVRSVNGEEPDENGDIPLTVVPYAQNLQSESAQRSHETFVQHTSGGTASIENGDAWLMLLQGNSVHDGYVPESLEMTVDAVDTENPITATLNRDTFVSYVEESGTTLLVYSTAWSADPALYGVTVIGTPTAGDTISIVYVKEERGTITVATPKKFVSTGWNLYSNTTGYAKVVKYEESYRISGTYTSIQYSATLTGTRSDIAVNDGNFDVPADGYVWVTGGNSTDTAIYAVWTNWTDGYTGDFATYTESVVDLTTVMDTYFPVGLLKAGSVVDELNLNIGQAISRVEQLSYSAENLATAKASGREYEYDENFIYLARVSQVVNSVSIDGSVMADDHGIEYFTDTEVGVYAEVLYGNNLKNKLERDVLTISPQTLTSDQKSQVRNNFGLGVAATYGVKDNLTTSSDGFLLDAKQGKKLKDALDDFTYTQLENNANLNNLKTQGFYASSSAASTQTMTGRPSTLTSAFTMLVMKKSSSTTQVIFIGNAIYCRTSTSGGWGSWYSFTGTAVN